MRKYIQRMRAIRDMNKLITEIESHESEWKHTSLSARNTMLLKKWKAQLKVKTFCVVLKPIEEQRLKGKIRVHTDEWNPCNIFLFLEYKQQSIAGKFTNMFFWLSEKRKGNFYSQFRLYSRVRLIQRFRLNQSKPFLLFLQQLVEQDVCAVAGLIDEELMRRCLRFYSSSARWLVDILTQGQGENAEFPLPKDVPVVFGALPDFFIEDIVEFLLFIDM